MDPKNFVTALELAELPSESVLDIQANYPSFGFPGESREKKEQGFVDCGSLVSFTENLSGQNKEDVLYSTLLAQLAANKKYHRETQHNEWYKRYMEVLENVGWVAQRLKFDQYKSRQGSFEISEVVIELLTSLVGDDNPHMISVVKKTLKALQKPSSDAIKLFGSNSSSAKSGNFQIVPCTLDKSGQVTVGFIGCYFEASEVDRRFLFFTYHDSKIKLCKSADRFTLNEKVYEEVRDIVRKKIGDKAKRFLVDVDI